MAGTTSGVKFTQRGDDHDLQIFQGKTINFSLTWGGANPIDVTGFDARMQIRTSTSAESATADFNVGNSRVSIGGANGVITFSMTAADCAALAAGEYVYDIELIDDSSNVFQVMSGNCTITGEATK